VAQIHYFLLFSVLLRFSWQTEGTTRNFFASCFLFLISFNEMQWMLSLPFFCFTYARLTSSCFLIFAPSQCNLNVRPLSFLFFRVFFACLLTTLSVVHRSIDTFEVSLENRISPFRFPSVLFPVLRYNNRLHNTSKHKVRCAETGNSSYWRRSNDSSGKVFRLQLYGSRGGSQALQ
jgi:hypothetical protein